MEKDEIEILDEDIIRHEEDHKKEIERLLKMIDDREELIRLLKIAKPERIAQLRDAISSLDKSIEATEEIIASIEDLIQKKREHLENLKELLIMSEEILQGMREHFADQPEKMEQIEAMLEDDGSSH